jgi:hypothetical protein
MMSSGIARSRLAGAVGLAMISCCLMLVGAGSAVAAVVESDHYHDVGTVRETDFCGGKTDFRHHFDFHGVFSTKTRGPGTPLYFSDNFHGYDAFTNLETSKSFTVVNNGILRDKKITVNTDGTLTIVQQFSGAQIVRDDAGKIVFKDRGTVRFAFVVDYNGTLRNPDDDVFVRDVGELHRAGKFDTLNRDFCADLYAFTA